MQEQILALMIPAMSLIFAAIFVALWRQRRARTYILAYAYWFAAEGAGIAVQTWKIISHGPLLLLTYHVLTISGLIALLWGVARRDERRVPVAAFILLSATTGGILWQARLLELQSVILTTQNFNAGLLLALGAYGKWQMPQSQGADRLLLVTLVMMAAYAILRPPIVIVLQSQMPMQDYHGSVLMTANVAMTALLCLMLSLALIATILSDNMQSERDEALLDTLSGLPTRRAFENLYEDLLTRAAAVRCELSMIVVDLDHFKRVNDTWGHSAGDTVIRSFGNMLSGKIRPSDIAGRIGGEEFCFVVWDCNADHAAELAERIRKATLQLGVRQGDQNVKVSASFGVTAVHPNDSYAEAFERADEALYKAKYSGRNQVCIWGEEKAEVNLDALDDLINSNVVSLSR